MVRYLQAFIFCLIALFNVAQAFDETLPERERTYFEKGATPDFSNTLLIVNFNHPYYDSIDFLKEIYSTVFPHIVIYGEKPHPDVIDVPQHMGWWGQNVLQDAMKRFPEYDGYLCVQDDCFMNFWNFARLDKNKVWINKEVYSIPLNNFFHPWYWWHQPSGREALIVALGKLSETHYQNIQKNNAPECVSSRLCDLIYVPGRLRAEYVEICPLFMNPNTFVELALPQILLALEDKENFEELHYYCGDNVRQNYRTGFDWVHPIKFSQKTNRDFVKSIIGYWETNRK